MIEKRAKGAVSSSRREGAAVRWYVNRDWLNAPLVVLAGYGLLGLTMLWAGAGMLRGLLAAVLALFGPGYALMSVLFPRKGALDAVERTALAGGLSLAVGGVSGFLLTFSPWGLSLQSVLVVQVLFSLGCLVLVWARQWHRAGSQEMGEDSAGAAWSGRWQQWWGGQERALQWATVVLAALVLTGAVALGWRLMVPTADPPMTEFYILNSDGLAGDYPATIVPGQPLPVQFGVVNREAGASSYEVRAEMAGDLLDGAGPIVLRPGETWLGELRLALSGDAAVAGPEAGAVEFVLARDGQPYRSLHLWLAVEDAGSAAAAAAERAAATALVARGQ